MSTRTLQELVAASEHLYHEVRMLRGVAKKIEEIPTVSGGLAYGDQIARNCLLESFCIHARSLCDFLYGPRSKPHREDVLARHFDCTWCREEPKVIRERRDQLNYMNAHLSYKRLTASSRDREWPTGPIAEALLTDLRDLLSRVPDEMLGTKAKSLEDPNALDVSLTTKTISTGSASVIVTSW